MYPESEYKSWARNFQTSLRNGEGFERLKRERALLVFAKENNWDREAVIAYCLRGISGWLGREVFEQGFDDGSMRGLAEWYDRSASEIGF